ncbi:delta and Notch-like epidermal growth factor-related receptor [Amphiura filiformis]|uniref:delta and Notch-like epidermal growth factor-related receptor n=1 Tax=Amphiura filiformis TaxID=82378 RepID=UPI003B216B27
MRLATTVLEYNRILSSLSVRQNRLQTDKNGGSTLAVKPRNNKFFAPKSKSPYTKMRLIYSTSLLLVIFSSPYVVGQDGTGMGAYEDLTCASNPCQNAGTCLSDMFGLTFFCRCNGLYTGRLCEQQISVIGNECAQPCQNGGNCVPTVPARPASGDRAATAAASFVCQCPNGLRGPDCTTPGNNACNSNPCENGATCIETATGYVCLCPAGYEGVTCDGQTDLGM